MQRIDVVILAALVLAAAASAVGALTYEDDRLAEFTIGWDVRTAAAASGSVAHAGAGEVETTIEIAQPNITTITFTVTLSGGPARVQPTAIRVEVISPTNDTTSVEGELPVGPTGSVDLPVELTLAPIPGATAATGPSMDAAQNSLNATLSSSLGIGTWTIRASFAPSTPGIGGQEAHTLAASAAIEYYRAELSIVGPEVG